MANKMLIDAAHEEETRVVVVRGNRVEEFDFEAAHKKQLRGNIYLAKVTRVEPSLQAAFVDYGGNRHGFLAFSEIHPDYYQIPYADRQALRAEEAEDDEHGDGDNGEGNGYDGGRRRDDGEAEADAQGGSEVPDDADGGAQAMSAAQDADDSVSMSATPAAVEDTAEAASQDAAISAETKPEGQTESRESEDAAHPEHGLPAETSGGVEDIAEEDEQVESVGAEDAMEEVPVRRQHRRRRVYKIQEVIKRRQILLVQVVKEERGNKGAALTTYLSIAGRYCVLMPNTARGGGISRKITNATDRRRLKQVAEDLDLPKGMGVILRTAGASRTKAEVKRDFEYLIRLWENVRELTLKSTAPTLVYEEGSLIKRAIRDLYSKEIDEILVSGDEGYKEAKSFMRMLMPSHAKNVQPYKEPEPIFSRSNVEAQLDAMFSPQVTLRSGGYIVLNQTEALVSIDVNSGRATREHNIEDTALSTNLEAAEEIARQLRLRDLAGLIVIDFIDMDEKRNKRAIERRLKECLRHDRARIQVGHISHFGLLEMSRQRIRAGVLEGSTIPCPHCQGTGIIRSVESVALHVLRAIEEALLKGRPANITARTNASAALYILNQKREHLRGLEDQFGVTVIVEADDKVVGAHPIIERGEPAARAERARHAPVHLADESVDIDEIVEEAETVEEDESEAAAGETQEARDEDDEGERRGRRRRRRRRGGRGRERDQAEKSEQSLHDDQPAAGADLDDDGDEDDGDEEAESGTGEAQPDEQNGQRESRRRRRGRRGGRGRRDRTRQERGDSVDEAGEAGEASALTPDSETTPADEAVEGDVAGREDIETGELIIEPIVFEEPISVEPADDEPATREALREPEAAAPATLRPMADATGIDEADDIDEREEVVSAAPPVDEEETPPAPTNPPRTGWWRRRLGSS